MPSGVKGVINAVAAPVKTLFLFISKIPFCNKKIAENISYRIKTFLSNKNSIFIYNSTPLSRQSGKSYLTDQARKTSAKIRPSATAPFILTSMQREYYVKMTLGILRLYYFITYYHIIVIMSTDFVIFSLGDNEFLYQNKREANNHPLKKS